jgi:NitT/TauT family transport system permease protein
MTSTRIVDHDHPTESSAEISTADGARHAGDGHTDPPVAELSTRSSTPSMNKSAQQHGRTWAAIWPRALAISVTISVWWMLTAVIWADNPVLGRIGPVDSLPALWHGLVDGALLGDLRASLIRLGVGLFIAFVIGVPLGAALGASRGLEQATAPITNFIRMISPLAWAPVVIVAVGVGSAPVILLIAITAIWPLMLGTASGVRAVTPTWHALATSLGANDLERLRYITVPAIRANLLTSLRLALGVAWIVLVPAEMLGVDSGLGYAVLNARDQLDYAGLGATVLLIGITGFALDSAFRFIFRVDPRTSS